MEDDSYFEDEEFSPLRSLLGLLTFSTILPINVFTSIEYMTKLTEARNKWLAQRSKKDETDKQIEINIPKSVEALAAKRDELGLTDEQASEILSEIFQMGSDLEVGIIPIRMFELMAKGLTRDADVETAREEGVAEGLNTKVTDKLRAMPKTNEQVSGRQMPVREVKPKRQYNPFVGED